MTRTLCAYIFIPYNKTYSNAKWPASFVLFTDREHNRIITRIKFLGAVVT